MTSTHRPARGLAALRLAVCTTLCCAIVIATSTPATADKAADKLAASLKHHVTTLVRGGPRNLAHPKGYRHAADYIQSTLAASGVAFRLLPIPTSPLVPPTIEAYWDAMPHSLILCAHYDTMGDSPGGLDNASGVAVLLETACALHEAAPVPGLRVIFFPNEEDSLFMTAASGSHCYAELLAASGTRAGRVVAVDSVDGPLLVGARRASAALARHLAATLGGRAHAEAVVTDVGAFWVDRSDHHPFTMHGWQGALITGSKTPLNNKLHTPADKALNLKYDLLVDTVRALTRFASRAQ